ncbi:MAG: hypothetical protein H7338_08060 [Candidatus Sericytochromatia bacterium]|nr:hypothetical protein [Candidatus Sericytochromatia bacterium]
MMTPLTRLTALALADALSACAYTAPTTAGAGRTALLMRMDVEGSFQAANPNVTYYVVFNATATPSSDVLVGPRFNGPNVARPREFIEGRLPFIYQLINDLPSAWTDFYFFQGTADGRGRVGRGAIREGLPVILDENYAANQWTLANNNKSLNMTIFLDQLTGNPKPTRLDVSLGTGDSITDGYGMIFDRWKNNVPFHLEISPTIQRDTDISPATVINVPNRPLTQLPPGVGLTDVNIVGWEARAAS